MEKNMTKQILKRHWKMSLFTVTRSSNQQQQKIYIYLKLTVDLLLRAMMPFFFFTASRTSLYEL